MFKPYEQYKPSGVEWLGDVPEHWGALPLKRRHRIVNGGTPSSGEESYWDGEVNWITPEDLGRNETKRIGSSRRTLSLEGLKNCGAHLVSPNSIILSTRAPIGHVALTERESCTNQGCRALVSVTGGAVPDFVYSALVASRPVLQASGKGTTFLELAAGALGIHAVPFPPAEEQRAIADFLDRETTKIDLLVAKKRTLIERLKEKRSALISRTVTRGLPPDAARASGLDPHPSLKPSGIDGLQNIPECWTTRRLRHISNVITVGVVVNPSSYVSEEGVPFLLGGDVREFVIDTTKCNRCSEESSNGPLRKSRLTTDDVVVVRVGYPGVAAVIPPELDGANCASMMIVRRHPRFCSRWLVYVFNSQIGRDQIEIVQYGAAQKQFNINHAVDFTFPFPPLPEQHAIADYLEQETAKINQMITKVETAIERLQEYRIALITAAVTGKIDVRGTAA